MLLFKKYKPNTFGDFIDLNTNLEVLLGFLNKSSDCNIFSFIGPSGSGKTALAEVFAKLVLCSNRMESTSCGTCLSCVSFKTGNNPSYKYITFMNSKADTIFNESLVEHESLKRVFILDNADTMPLEIQKYLSTSQDQNNLFLLCLENENNLSLSLKSKALSLYFEYPSPKSLLLLLKNICESENHKYEGNALEKLACLASGNVQKAIMFLEQVMFLGEVNMTSISTFIFASSAKEYESIFLNLQNPDKIYKSVNLLINRLSIRLIYEGLSDYALKSFCISDFNNALKDRFGKKLLVFSKQLVSFSRRSDTVNELICDLLLLEDHVASNTAYKEFGDTEVLGRTSSRVLMQQSLIKKNMNKKVLFDAHMLSERLGITCRKIGGLP